jgi:hypothetical protein
VVDVRSPSERAVPSGTSKPRKLSVLLLVILAALTACSRPATSSEIEALHVLVTDASGAPLPSFPILVRVWAHEPEYETAKGLNAPLVSDEHGLLHFAGVAAEAARFHAIAIDLSADLVQRDEQVVKIDLTRRLKPEYTIRVPDNGSITVYLKCALVDRLNVSGKGRVTVLRPELRNDFVSDHGFLPGRDFEFEGSSIEISRVALGARFWVWLQPADHVLPTVVVVDGPQRLGEMTRGEAECGESETLLRARLLVNDSPLSVGALVRWTMEAPERNQDEEPHGYRLGNCKSDGELDIVINAARVPAERLKFGYEWEPRSGSMKGSVTLTREQLATGPVIDMGTVKLK